MPESVRRLRLAHARNVVRSVMAIIDGYELAMSNWILLPRQSAANRERRRSSATPLFEGTVSLSRTRPREVKRSSSGVGGTALAVQEFGSAVAAFHPGIGRER